MICETALTVGIWAIVLCVVILFVWTVLADR